MIYTCSYKQILLQSFSKNVESIVIYNWIKYIKKMILWKITISPYFYLTLPNY